MGSCVYPDSGWTLGQVASSYKDTHISWHHFCSGASFSFFPARWFLLSVCRNRLAIAVYFFSDHVKQP